jgi:hypothetical protein
MKPADRLSELKKFMVTLHVITGWPIPEQEYRVVFLNQLEKKLMEDYSYLNMTELELAFRQNGGGKAFGASMNLSLIQEVLDDFKVVRLEVARKANQEAANALRINPMTDEELINEARAEIEFYYQQILKGNKRPLTFPFWAEVLKEDGFIQQEDQMENFFTFCLNNSVKNIYTCENVNSL